MKKLLFVFIILTTAASISQNETTSTPKIIIKIALGKTISIESHQVTFLKILEDSRCPKYTTCIWAGRAKVLVEISEKGKESLQKQLIFGQLKQGESKELTLFTSEEKKVVGITLRPYPSAEDSGTEKEYQLLVSIEKNEK